ncbi:type II toxin-antitoxin system RelE family toxin [Salana multivorans]
MCPGEPDPVTYEVRLTSSAVRDLESVPPRYAAAIVAFLFGPLAENPPRVGKPLRQDFSGLHGARRGHYRVIYEILEPEQAVLVHRVDHRARVYRPR